MLFLFIKNDKQSIKKFHFFIVSLLPVCSKVFERMLYNNMFSFFTEYNLISQNQSIFKPGNPWNNQLLWNTHDICKSFDDGWDVRGVFLDISKAFDEVRHQGLIVKLKENGISGNLLKIIEDFHSNRCQRVVLNGQAHEWAEANTGDPKVQFLVLCWF